MNRLSLTDSTNWTVYNLGDIPFVEVKLYFSELLKTAADEEPYIGYLLVNISTVPTLRKYLLEGETLRTIYELMGKGGRWREIAADTFRNMCFEEGLCFTGFIFLRVGQPLWRVVF